MDEKIDLKLYSPNSFSELEHIWKRLEKGNDMTPFQSYDWYKGLNSINDNLVEELMRIRAIRLRGKKKSQD